MKSKQYWSNRANERMATYHKNSDQTVYKINAAHDKAIKDINEDINKIFYKYQFDSGLSPGEVRDMLNSSIPKKELDSIRNRIYGIQDEEMKKYMMAQLNADSVKARITRLEAMKESININTKLVADVELRETTKLYTNNIKDAYYKNLYDIQKGVGVGFNVAQMPKATIEEILKSRWSGENYSKRIWRNSDILASKLEEVLTSGLMSGKSSKKMAKELSDLTDYGKFAAERVIRTETTYVTNMAELESYRECGIEAYRYLATLDLRTSKACRDMDGKVVKLSDAVAGENLPPLHPYCRSTTVAYFGDEELQGLQRRARDPKTGENYIIDNVNYNQWYDDCVIEEKVNSNESKTKLSFKDKIDNCTSLEELSQLATEEFKKDGVKKVRFEGTNLERSKEMIVQLDRLIKEYNTDPILEIVTEDKLMGGSRTKAEVFRAGEDKECMMTFKKRSNQKYITPDKYKGVKDTDNWYSVVDAKNANVLDVAHEFAHTFSNPKQGYDKEFWKEIRGVKARYTKELNKIDRDKSITTYKERIEAKSKIFISEYANESIGEFMAEAFCEAKLSKMPSKYSSEVLEVVDKYFKKDSLNIPKSGIIKERNIINRNMANGMRTSPHHILTKDEIESIKKDIRSISADESIFRFNEGIQTSYNDRLDIIKVKGDILPDLNSIHPRDKMSQRAVLAHEYYGHRTFRGTAAKKGSWNDEFRASYIAARDCPNLTGEERYYLILDAIERAKENGIQIKNNKFIKGILYGY